MNDGQLKGVSQQSSEIDNSYPSSPTAKDLEGLNDVWGVATPPANMADGHEQSNPYTNNSKSSNGSLLKSSVLSKSAMEESGRKDGNGSNVLKPPVSSEWEDF